MNSSLVRWAGSLIAVMVILTGKLPAQHEGALVDALVKKGILTAQEGEEIRSDLVTDYLQTDGGKLNLKGSKYISQFTLYGDVRFRYQWENEQDARTTGNNDRSRFRYRLRVGANYDFAENWKAGIRFETSNASDSTNANYGGYFDKVGDDLYVGLAFLEYENDDLFETGWVDYVDVRMGKHIHPYMISKAFWDGDINPEGFSEQIGWNDIATEGLDLTLRGGQYIISETDNRVTGNIAAPSNNPAGASRNNEDAWLFMAQGEVKYSWQKGHYVAVAPTYMVETTGDLFDEETGSTGANENESRTLGNVEIFMLPAEVGWKMWNQPWKAYGTWGINLEAARMKDVANYYQATALDSDADDMFWNAGIKVGKAKKKGSWELGFEYRWLEAFSYSTNLADSDFSKNHLNQQGFVISGKYALTDFLYAGITYFNSDDINKRQIVTTSAVGESDANSVQVLQVDLNYKF